MPPALPTRAEAIAEMTAPGQPYELRTIEVGPRRLKVFANAPASLRAIYEQTATDATFIVYEDERYTFAQAWAQASRIGHLLAHRYGVRKGDRVAIAMRNYPEWILAFCAATSIGAIAVAMNAWWQPDEMAYGLRDSGATVLLADQERLDRFVAAGGAGQAGTSGGRAADAADALRGVRAIAVRPTKDNGGIPDLATLLADVGDVPMPPVDLGHDDDAFIFYTSGSTGHPKGVLSQHRAVVHTMLSWEFDALLAAKVTGIEPPAPEGQSGSLLGIPLFHVTASHAVYLMSYRLQRKLVSMYKWDPALGAELIERERLTQFVGPAAVTGDLVREAERTGRSLATLLAVGGGGAPRAPEQVRRIDAVFERAAPATGWGMTETNAIGTGIGGEDYLKRPESSGRCSVIDELKIVDDQGREVPVGERGELLIRGTTMFRCYWNRPELAATTFDADGWFRTGDVAYLDDEGFLFIVDRIKDLIIRGGENIGCGQVEAALLMHPKVHEAAVYAVPDERLGEEVGATVCADPGLDAETLRAFLAQHLAKFEIPRYLRITAAPLARTATGKILKRQLRDDAVAELTRKQA